MPIASRGLAGGEAQVRQRSVEERSGDRPLLTNGGRCESRYRDPKNASKLWQCILIEGHTGKHYTDSGDRYWTNERAVGYQPAVLPRHYRELGTKTVRTSEDLKRLVEIYSEFPEFAFDVETRAGRRVRMLSPAKRSLTRQQSKGVCPSCGNPLPPRRRSYCSDVCQKAAAKDKPALDVRTNQVWCISLAGPGRADVIPIGHPDPRPQLRRAEVFEALGPLFFSDRVKVNQNVGFDLMSIAKYYGDEIPPGPYSDVLMLVFLLNENLGTYKLGNLAKHYLGYQYAEKLGEEAYRVEWGRAMRYSILDARVAWRLWAKLSPALHRREKLAELFKLEMEVLGVLMHMRQTGAFVDLEGFRQLHPLLMKQRDDLRFELANLAGTPINPNSTQQLGKWLYDDLHLPPLALTETGQRSTAAGTLKVLARKHQAPRMILEYKDINKLLTTYVAGFLPHIDPDSRIRASFNQAVARTGRLSCSDPNLQNIPARYKETVEATLIRQFFQAPPGRVLIVADYSQIELRILAHQTKDKRLLYAYKEGIDLHTLTASLIYKVPVNEVTVEQRAIAKNANFNFAFEGGPGRVVEMSGIPLREAEKVYDGWHSAYPGVKRYGTWVKRFCWDHGYVETLYGRKRRLPDIASSDNKERRYAERQAVNHPIQGTAADIAKVAIVKVFHALQGYDAALTLQVHDELVIECVAHQVEEVVSVIKPVMENIQLGGRPVLDVPLEVNIGVGMNWASAK